jgi:hypothetical protein
MQPGDVVDGLLVEAVGTTRDGVTRARVRGPDGAPGELLWVIATAPEARARFLEGHRQLVALDVPGLARPHRVLDGPDLAGVHRERTGDVTLERLTGPLPPGVAEAIGARVLPAVVACAPWLGELQAEDLAVSASGEVLLAPRLGRAPRPGDDAVAALGRLLARWGVAPAAARALSAGDVAAAAAALGDPSAPLDLTSALAAHPAALEVRVTATAHPDDDAGPAIPAATWRAGAWALGLALWLASAAAALTVVLLPFAVLGFAAGAAVLVGGEVAARRALLTGPATADRRRVLPDRTLQGRTTAAWSAVDAARSQLAAARLPELLAGDVRAVIDRWEDALHELQGAPADELDARASDTQDRIVGEHRRLGQLIGRLATDDESAMSELARWVHAGAP